MIDKIWQCKIVYVPIQMWICFTIGIVIIVSLISRSAETYKVHCVDTLCLPCVLHTSTSTWMYIHAIQLNRSIAFYYIFFFNLITPNILRWYLKVSAGNGIIDYMKCLWVLSETSTEFRWVSVAKLRNFSIKVCCSFMGSSIFHSSKV